MRLSVPSEPTSGRGLLSSWGRLPLLQILPYQCPQTSCNQAHTRALQNQDSLQASQVSLWPSAPCRQYSKSPHGVRTQLGHHLPQHMWQLFCCCGLRWARGLGSMPSPCCPQQVPQHSQGSPASGMQPKPIPAAAFQGLCLSLPDTMGWWGPPLSSTEREVEAGDEAKAAG